MDTKICDSKKYICIYKNMSDKKKESEMNKKKINKNK